MVTAMKSNRVSHCVWSPLGACALFPASSPHFQKEAHISASKGSQHSKSGASTPRSPPLDAALSDSEWQTEYEAEITDLSSNMSEQHPECLDFTINSDFSPPSSAVIGDRTQNSFSLKNPNLHYQSHPRINGEILPILNISAANFVDHWQENLVNKTAAIQCLESNCACRHL